MPIGKQSKLQQACTLSSSQQSSSATASYVAQSESKPQVVFTPISVENIETDLPPSYDESEACEDITKLILQPTVEEDLDFFHATASATTPNRQPSSKVLVLNLFRTTQTQLLPIEERISLGPTFKQPFYALRSGASSKSVDEFNLLTVIRRNPATNAWTDAAISEIEPRIKLLSQGIMIISRISTGRRGSLSEIFHDLTYDSSTGSYTLWRNNGTKVDREVEIVCDGWMSLDDSVNKGVITAKSSHNEERLAHIAASESSTQLISLSPRGHKMMDFLVAGLLTVAIVHTRKSRLLRQRGVASNGQNTFVYTKTNAKIRIDI